MKIPNLPNETFSSKIRTNEYLKNWSFKRFRTVSERFKKNLTSSALTLVYVQNKECSVLTVDTLNPNLR